MTGDAVWGVWRVKPLDLSRAGKNPAGLRPESQKASMPWAFWCGTVIASLLGEHTWTP
jgi:hypothetical protein